MIWNRRIKNVMLRLSDTNLDNQLDFDEFIKIFQRQLPDCPVNPAMDYKRYNDDGDRQLDLDEFTMFYADYLFEGARAR